MKNKLNYFLLIVLFLSACRQSTPKTETAAEDLPVQKTTLTWKDANSPTFPKVSAHRGGMAYDGYPENALETIQYVFGKTGAIIECDIAMTDDGKLILMHDSSLRYGRPPAMEK